MRKTVDEKEYITRNSLLNHTPYSSPHFINHSEWSLHTILYGFTLALEGCWYASQSPKIRSRFLRLLFYQIIITLVLYIITRLCLFPFYFFLGLLSYFGTSIIDFKQILDNFIHRLLNFIPQIALYAVRYIWPTPADNIFFDTVISYPEKEDIGVGGPSSSIANQNLPIIKNMVFLKSHWSLKNELLSYGKRFTKKGVLWIMISVLSYLPVIGWTILPATTYITLRKISPTIAFIVLLLEIIPAIQNLVIRYVLGFLFSLRLTSRELLGPYLQRCRMSSKERREWFQFNEPIIFGFMIPFTILISLPWIGPMFFALGFAASVRLTLELHGSTGPQFSKVK